MTSTELDDIWDLPAEPYILPGSTSTSFEIHGGGDDDNDAGDAAVPRKSKPPLFLNSDSDDDATAARRVSPPATRGDGPSSSRPDIDALFDDVEDDTFQELAPALDLGALRRAADARNAQAARATFSSQIPSQTQVPTQEKRKGKGKGKGTRKDALGAGDEGEEDGDDGKQKKKRRVLPKLNEERLLGKDGFPQLVKDTKHFMPKGKGRELEDLDRVMQVYQFWAHRMYPKTRFKETVQRVEKLCHSKRMNVALSVWRDEAKGMINGQKLSDPEDEVIDLTDGEENAPQYSRTSSPVEGAPRKRAAIIDLDDDDEGAISSSASRPPTLPPSSPTSGPENYDDMDLDAILEADAVAATASSTNSFMDAHAPSITDNDEAMWNALKMDAQIATTALKKPAPQLNVDEDEDMWDIVREAEWEGESRPKVTANTPPSARMMQASRQAEEDEWESMYA